MSIKDVYNSLASTYDQGHYNPKSTAEYVENKRLNQIYPYLERSSNMNVLDVACGTGTYISIAKKFGEETVGCDVSEMFRVCKEKCLLDTFVNNYHSRTFCRGINMLPFPTSSDPWVESVLNICYSPEDTLNRTPWMYASNKIFMALKKPEGE